MKALIKKLLRESLLDEAAFSSNNLPENTGLFIEPNNSGASLTLYNPKLKTAYATITFISHITQGPYHWVSGVAALKGFGPLIYELAFMYVDSINSKLMPSRNGDVRTGAFNVWEKMFTRNDINKITLEITDDNFRFDIITGVEDDMTPEEKIELFNDSNKSEKNALLVFNTAYSKSPTNDFKQLINIANQYNQKIHDDANKAGDKLWQSSYE